MMKDTLWRIEYNQKISASVFEMKLRTDDFSAWADFTPGQFVHIRIPNASQLLLRRPISVHLVLPQEKAIIIQYAVVGEGTRSLSFAEKGEELVALGPIGRGFPTERKAKIWLLGGGMGIAPLFAATQQIPESTFTAFLGWRSQEEVYAYERWEAAASVHPFTDNGSWGKQGFALDGMLAMLEKERPNLLFACGPTPMFHALKQRWPSDIPCYVSLEERMACGLGACLVCSCKTKAESVWVNRRVCVDGPVFRLQEVDFS